MQRFAGKHAIVTGGSAGIGAAIVRRLAREGCRVLIADLDPRPGESLAMEFPGLIRVRQADVAQEQDVAAVIADAVAAWGRLDILVNNAGLALPAAPVEETSLAEFDQLIGVNLRSAFLGCKLAYPELLKSRGCVLNISSMAGLTGQERHAIYGATKGALNALTKCMAIDWGRAGIRVNALCPAGVWTDTLRRWVDASPNAAEMGTYLAQIHALGYCPEPTEIADVAAFLCSDDARFVTGCILPVTGGGDCGYRVHAPLSSPARQHSEP